MKHLKKKRKRNAQLQICSTISLNMGRYSFLLKFLFIFELHVVVIKVYSQFCALKSLLVGWGEGTDPQGSNKVVNIRGKHPIPYILSSLLPLLLTFASIK